MMVIIAAMTLTGCCKRVEVINPGMNIWFYGYCTGVVAANPNVSEEALEAAYQYVDSVLSCTEIATDMECQQFQCAVDSVLGIETTLWY